MQLLLPDNTVCQIVIRLERMPFYCHGPFRLTVLPQTSEPGSTENMNGRGQR